MEVLTLFLKVEAVIEKEYKFKKKVANEVNLNKDTRTINKMIADINENGHQKIKEVGANIDAEKKNQYESDNALRKAFRERPDAEIKAIIRNLKVLKQKMKKTLSMEAYEKYRKLYKKMVMTKVIQNEETKNLKKSLIEDIPEMPKRQVVTHAWFSRIEKEIKKVKEQLMKIETAVIKADVGVKEE